MGGGQLEAVQAALLAAAGGCGVVGDDAADVGVLHLLRDGAAGRLAHRRGATSVGSQSPVSQRGAPAHMGELDHQRGTVPVDTVGELLEERDDASSATEIWFQSAAGLSMATEEEPPNMVSADAALGLLLVIELIALLGLAVRPVGGRMAVLITRLRMVRFLILKGRSSASTADMVMRFPVLTR